MKYEYDSKDVNCTTYIKKDIPDGEILNKVIPTSTPDTDLRRIIHKQLNSYFQYR